MQPPLFYVRFEPGWWVPSAVSTVLSLVVGIAIGAAEDVGLPLLLVVAVGFAGPLVEGLAHELAHAGLSLLFGVRTYGIIFHMEGAEADIDRFPRSAVGRWAVALAGPAVSAAVCVGAVRWAFSTDAGWEWIAALTGPLFIAGIGLIGSFGDDGDVGRARWER